MSISSRLTLLIDIDIMFSSDLNHSVCIMFMYVCMYSFIVNVGTVGAGGGVPCNREC